MRGHDRRVVHLFGMRGGLPRLDPSGKPQCPPRMHGRLVGAGKRLAIRPESDRAREPPSWHAWFLNQAPRKELHSRSYVHADEERGLRSAEERISAQHLPGLSSPPRQTHFLVQLRRFFGRRRWSYNTHARWPRMDAEALSGESERRSNFLFCGVMGPLFLTPPRPRLPVAISVISFLPICALACTRARSSKSTAEIGLSRRR